jgi:hypothetical protein
MAVNRGGSFDWHEGYCAARAPEGSEGYLASIHSDAEGKFVQSLCGAGKRQPITCRVGLRHEYNEWYWSDWSRLDYWWTPDGEALSSPEWPDGLPSDPQCVNVNKADDSHLPYLTTNVDGKHYGEETCYRRARYAFGVCKYTCPSTIFTPGPAVFQMKTLHNSFFLGMVNPAKDQNAAMEACFPYQPASIPDAKTQVRVQETLGDAESKYVWTGGEKVNGVWQWHDGTPIEGYTNWDQGEPSNGEDYLCLRVSNGKWHACTASQKYSVLCVERQAEPKLCSAMSVSDFPSVESMREAGWDIDFGIVMSESNQFRSKCGEGRSFFGWSAMDEIGAATLVLPAAGTGELDFGNCWDDGHNVAEVTVYINDGMVAVAKNAEEKTVSFAFQAGDVLKVTDGKRGSIAMIKRLALECGASGGEELLDDGECGAPCKGESGGSCGAPGRSAIFDTACARPSVGAAVEFQYQFGEAWVDARPGATDRHSAWVDAVGAAVGNAVDNDPGTSVAFAGASGWMVLDVGADLDAREVRLRNDGSPGSLKDFEFAYKSSGHWVKLTSGSVRQDQLSYRRFEFSQKARLFKLSWTSNHGNTEHTRVVDVQIKLPRSEKGRHHKV